MSQQYKICVDIHKTYIFHVGVYRLVPTVSKRPWYEEKKFSIKFDTY